MSRFFAVAVVLGLMAFGCAEKKVATQPDQPLDQTRAKTEQAKGPEKITEQQIAKVDSQDLGARPEEVRGMFKDINFVYAKYDIRDDAKPVLKSVADYLGKNTSHKVLIEGHCDERGTNEYNLAEALDPGAECRVTRTTAEALEDARRRCGPRDCILCCGSFYLVGDILKLTGSI